MQKIIIIALVALITAASAGVPRRCSSGFEWDAERELCARQIQRDEGTTIAPSPDECPVTCRYEELHDFPHLRDCNRYYQCYRGYLFELECEFGEIWDIQTLRCSTSGQCATDRSK